MTAAALVLHRCPRCQAAMPAHPAARLSHHCPHNRNRETDRLAAIAEMSEP